MFKAYLATFSSGVSEVYLVTWTFRSMDVQSVSEFYLASFYPCIRKPYLLVLRSDLEISSVLFLSFLSVSQTNLHSIFPLTLDRCIILS